MVVRTSLPHAREAPRPTPVRPIEPKADPEEPVGLTDRCRTGAMIDSKPNRDARTLMVCGLKSRYAHLQLRAGRRSERESLVIAVSPDQHLALPHPVTPRCGRHGRGLAGRR